MKIGGLNIAIAQINPVVGKIAYNLDLIEAALNTCASADVVVFPELAVCGYNPEDLILKPSFVQDCMDEAKAFIGRVQTNTAYVLTTPWMLDGKTYNAALFIHDRKIFNITYKHNLPNYGVFDEVRVFKSGAHPDVFTFKGQKIGILICEDIWFPEGAAHLKSQGAQIILSPNGSPYDTNKRALREKIITARIAETGIPIVYANQMSGQDDLVYDGGSMIFDGAGKKIFQAPYCEEYVGLCDESVGEQEKLPAIYDVLVRGLKDYIHKNNFKGVIIGMSGGIDSALSAAVAVDALGASNVRCVMMPSPFTSQDSFEDAKACCAMLGCSYEEISIIPAMKAFEGSIENLCGLAHENMQSRARGLILMSLSNQTGAMVLTTGNKSEMATGYATLYGDMCGGYNVLKDVYKTDVFALSHFRNKKSRVIPERILTKPPTAELKANQKDQDSLPPYDILDSILQGLIEQDKSPKDLVAEGHDLETVHKVLRLLDLAEYKRRQSAPGVKITPRAFGRERRYPITNGYKAAR